MTRQQHGSLTNLVTQHLQDKKNEEIVKNHGREHRGAWRGKNYIHIEELVGEVGGD